MGKLKDYYEKHKRLFLVSLFIITAISVFLLGLLAASVTERRAEIATLFNNKRVQITGIESRTEYGAKTFQESMRLGNRHPIQISSLNIMETKWMMFSLKDH